LKVKNGKGRDAFFQELFGRAPTAEEVRRFERMGTLASLSPDDSLWYMILVNEFYEDRLKARLAELDRVADNAADMAVVKLAERVSEKADALAERKRLGYLWRSWGFFMSLLVTLCAGILGAGYVMGSGKDPFWLKPENGAERLLSWFFNVPSGWIFLVGSAPFLWETFHRSLRDLSFGWSGRRGVSEQVCLFAKTAGAFLGLVFVLVAALAF
jgi:hypothetical protein